MSRHIIGWLFVLNFVFLPALSFAETIYLKSGKVVEGKIVEKTKEYIILETNLNLTFFTDEIERIEDSLVQPGALAKSEGELYVDEESGFEIRAPKGWLMYLAPPGRGLVVYFSKNIAAEGIPLNIALSVDSLSQRSSIADFAQSLVARYQATGLMFSEPLKKITIGNLEGFKFAGRSHRDKNGYVFCIMQYVFEKDGKLISVTYTSGSPEDFQKGLQDFEQAISSFRFLPAEEDIAQLGALNKMALTFVPIEENSYALLKKEILETMEATKTYKSLFILKDKKSKIFGKDEYIGMKWVMTYVSDTNFEIKHLNYYNLFSDMWRVVDGQVYLKSGSWIPVFDDAQLLAVISKQGQRAGIAARKEIYQIVSCEQYLELLRKEIPESIAEDSQKQYTIFKFRPREAKDLFALAAKKDAFQTEILIWVANKDKRIRLATWDIEGTARGNRQIKRRYEHYFSNYNSAFELNKPPILDEVKKE